MKYKPFGNGVLMCAQFQHDNTSKDLLLKIGVKTSEQVKCESYIKIKRWLF